MPGGDTTRIQLPRSRSHGQSALAQQAPARAELFAAIAGATDVHDLARRMVGQLRARLDFQRATFALLDRPARSFHARTVFEERPDVPRIDAVIPSGVGVFREFGADEPPLHVLAEERREWISYLRDPGLALERSGSVLILPLRGIAPSHTIGIVALGRFTRAFEAPEVELARTLAAYFELAIDRLRTTQTLARSRDFYLALFEEFPALIWRSGTDAACDYFNREWLRFTGRTLEQERGNGWLTGVHPDDVQGCLDGYMRAFEARAPFLLEYRLRRHDGRYRWIYDYGRPFLDLDGRFAGYIGSCYDVTDRKRAEATLRDLADLGTSLAGSLDYEATIATFGRLAVRSLADLCIVLVGEHDGQSLARVFQRDESSGGLAATIERSLAERRPSVASALGIGGNVLSGASAARYLETLCSDVESARSLREVEPAHVMAVPLDARGRIFGALVLVSRDPRRGYDVEDIAFARDLAARSALALESARLYRLSQQALAVRDEVLRIAAHDLRGPLNTIQLSAQALRGERPEGARDPVDTILRAARASDRLIRDLLDVTTIEAGTLSVEKRPHASRALLDHVMDGAMPAARAAHVTLELSMVSELPPVLGDEDRLLQVFSNLIGNALKFTPAGGRVTISAEPSDEGVEFSIADTGPGVPAEELPHVFDRYWKLDRTDRRGAGLGLAIVKGIVEAHGGRVWVTSVPGRGCRFSFVLPVATGEAP